MSGLRHSHLLSDVVLQRYQSYAPLATLLCNLRSKIVPIIKKGLMEHSDLKEAQTSKIVCNFRKRTDIFFTHHLSGFCITIILKCMIYNDLFDNNLSSVI